MATQVIQSAIKNENGVASSSLAFSSNVQAGTMLVVNASIYYFLGFSSVSVSDTRGNTWSAWPGTSLGGSEIASGDVILMSWYAISNGAGACTVTVDADPASAEYTFVVYEVGPIDASPFALASAVTARNTSGSTAPATGTIDPTTDPSFLLAVATHADGNTAFTPNASWTQVQEREDGNSGPVLNVMARDLVSGTTTASWTLGASAEWACHALALKSVGGAAATKAPPIPARRLRRALMRS